MIVDPPPTRFAYECLGADTLEPGKDTNLWFWLYILFAVAYHLLYFAGMVHQYGVVKDELKC